MIVLDLCMLLENAEQKLYLFWRGNVGVFMIEDDPLQPHAHDPNSEIPAGDGSFVLLLGNGRNQTITVVDLQQLPFSEVENCYIVSTGHGTSGPFTFGGVTLLDFIRQFVIGEWGEIEVVSVDGFGNRVYVREVLNQAVSRPILLSYALNGRPMTRDEGLVRMIVPQERDDALRQVKWIGQIRVV